MEAFWGSFRRCIFAGRNLRFMFRNISNMVQAVSRSYMALEGSAAIWWDVVMGFHIMEGLQ